MYILYTVQKNHTGPYYRVQALFMYGVIGSYRADQPEIVPLVQRDGLQHGHGEYLEQS